jgi:hypothetical protein
MNNFVLRGRTAATATVAAIFLAGHGAQTPAVEAATEVALQPLRFTFLDGSLGLVSTMRSSDVLTHSQDFAAAVNGAYEGLARRQTTLDADMARSLSEGAWDLYEEV